MQSQRPSVRCLGMQAGQVSVNSHTPCLRRRERRMARFNAETDCPIDREDLNPMTYLFLDLDHAPFGSYRRLSVLVAFG